MFKKICLLLVLAALSGQLAFGQVYKPTTVLLSTTSTETSAGFNVTAIAPFRHTVAVVVTGSPVSCTFDLEGAITTIRPASGDWFSLSGNQTCTSSIMFHVADRPVLWVRANLSVLSGGSSPTVVATYLGTR